MRYTILVSKDVENELRSTYYHIADKNKKAAKKVVQKIEKRIKELSYFPFRNQIFEFQYKTIENIRRIVVYNFYILYAVLKNDVVFVFKILYCGHDIYIIEINFDN